ncbi:HTH domain-containing protein [Aquimarina sp. 2201CG1-2-11]|uniref:HTH domain-containing protein n=1 Tax=Aquimarina discodermiae TaxID=3231043 RepID=UPI0034635026
MKKIDQLIRIKATGPPEVLALRLEVSKNTIYRTIKTMKLLNAPIIYDFSIQSYVYEKEVGYYFGFYLNNECK